MEKNYLESIIADLEQLRRKLLIAKNTHDNRKRGKSIRDAKLDISDYAHSLSGEVAGYLDTMVGTNALSYKWSEGDIDQCIQVLKDWKETMPSSDI